ncbi:MAG: hypothetical protein AAF492_14875, partial [Verrucomicrobiota bacterium]
MRTTVSIIAICLTVLMSFPHVVFAPPPALDPEWPGRSMGEVRTWWLAPYVRASTGKIGERGETRVTWFDREGGVIRDVAGDLQPGFVTTRANDVNRIYGVNEPWSFVLPKKPGRSGSIRSTRNSRTLIHEYYPEPGMIAVDIYIHGDLVKTLGPFVNDPLGGAELGEDGSIAMLIREGPEKQQAQVLTADPDGKIRFRVAPTTTSQHLHIPRTL